MGQIPRSTERILVRNTNTTLFADCPIDATITPDAGPFEAGDVLTCSADGYDPTYMWTGIVNGVVIEPQTGSSYTLPAGDFQLSCAATVSELMCTGTVSAEGCAIGKYQINTRYMFKRTQRLSNASL